MAADSETQTATGERHEGKSRWEVLLSSSLAVGTFVFGIISWWFGKKDPGADAAKPAEKIVVVAAPTPTAVVPTPITVAPPAAVPSADASKAASKAGPVPHVMKLSNGGTFSYYRNVSMREMHRRIDRALIFCPNSRASNDSSFYQSVLDQARRDHSDRNTLIVVPIFQVGSQGLKPGEVHWPAGWSHGEKSAGPRPIRPFQVLDELCGQIATAEGLPGLRKIVIAGSGMAGTFVNRYVAFGNPAIPADQARPIGVEYVVISPHSYLYPDALRPSAEEGRFAIPDPASCPGYNAYPYGLEGLDPDLAAVSPEQVRENLTRRPTTYVVGTLDTDNDKLDLSCAAMLQGRYRHARALNYINSLRRDPSAGVLAEFCPIPGLGRFTIADLDHDKVHSLVFGKPLPAK